MNYVVKKLTGVSLDVSLSESGDNDKRLDDGLTNFVYSMNENNIIDYEISRCLKFLKSRKFFSSYMPAALNINILNASNIGFLNNSKKLAYVDFKNFHEIYNVYISKDLLSQGVYDLKVSKMKESDKYNNLLVDVVFLHEYSHIVLHRFLMKNSPFIDESLFPLYYKKNPGKVECRITKIIEEGFADSLGLKLFIMMNPESLEMVFKHIRLRKKHQLIRSLAGSDFINAYDIGRVYKNILKNKFNQSNFELMVKESLEDALLNAEIVLNKKIKLPFMITDYKDLTVIDYWAKELISNKSHMCDFIDWSGIEIKEIKEKIKRIRNEKCIAA